MKFGKASVEKPSFFADDKELENMTYSSRVKVSVQVQVEILLNTFLLESSKLFLNRGLFYMLGKLIKARSHFSQLVYRQQQDRALCFSIALKREITYCLDTVSCLFFLSRLSFCFWLELQWFKLSVSVAFSFLVLSFHCGTISWLTLSFLSQLARCW